MKKIKISGQIGFEERKFAFLGVRIKREIKNRLLQKVAKKQMSRYIRSLIEKDLEENGINSQ